MQLSTFPPLPGFSAGLPTAAPAATTAAATGTSAENHAGFGEMLTAQTAATTPGQPTSKGHGSANTPASSRGGAGTQRPASAGDAQPNASTAAAAGVLSDGEPMTLLPISLGDAAIGGTLVDFVDPLTDSAAETLDVAPSDSTPESTLQAGTVEIAFAVQPPVVAPWLAPVAAEAGTMESPGLSSATSGSETGVSEESGAGSGRSVPAGRAPLSALAMQSTSDAQRRGDLASVAAGGTGFTSASASNAIEGNVSGKNTAEATAIRSDAEQIATAANGGDTARSTTAATGPQDTAVRPGSIGGTATARDRAAAMAKSDAMPQTASEVLPMTVSSGKTTTLLVTRAQDAIAAAEPMAMNPADAAAPKAGATVGAPFLTLGEKIAAALNEFRNGQGSPENQGQKHSLLTGDKLVKVQSQRLGTNTAQGELPMAASAQLTRSFIAEPEAMSFSAAPLTFDALVEEAAQGVEHTNSARKAVDAAMTLLDQAGKGTQRGVNLQFSVSGVDVAVRVEMRDDQVHTTFRTDSPELRAALAQEWQSVVSTHSADRSQKLADPVFTSTANAGSASGDSGASQQREPSTRQSQWENPSAFARSGAALPSDAAHAADSLSVRSARPETTRHLDAVA